MQSVLALIGLTEAQVVPYMGLILLFGGLSVVLLVGTWAVYSANKRER